MGPGRHPVPALASTVLADDDHPGLATIDDWLHGSDHDRIIPAPPRPRDRTMKHVRLGDAVAPGVVNPPSGRVRRQGSGAQWAAGWQTEREHQPDPIREALGAEYFEDEPELESAPAAELDVDPAALFGVGYLAKRLRRHPRTVRDWIYAGWMPDAVHFGPAGQYGRRKYWTGAEVDLIVTEAKAAGFLGSGGHNVLITETDFTARGTAGLEKLRGAGTHAQG
jgi:hypothetical protein